MQFWIFANKNLYKPTENGWWKSNSTDIKTPKYKKQIVRESNDLLLFYILFNGFSDRNSLFSGASSRRERIKTIYSYRKTAEICTLHTFFSLTNIKKHAHKKFFWLGKSGKMCTKTERNIQKFSKPRQISS